MIFLVWLVGTCVPGMSVSAGSSSIGEGVSSHEVFLFSSWDNAGILSLFLEARCFWVTLAAEILARCCLTVGVTLRGRALGLLPPSLERVSS